MPNHVLAKAETATATNEEWLLRKQNAMARGEAHLAPVFVERAKNAEIWDVEGKRYIDFGTGIAVCNTGHSHPKIVDAVTAQVERFSHTCVMVSPYGSAVALAERLNALAPGPSPKKTMFVTTGAEAVENAVKIARAHTGRRSVVSFRGGYHGRTNFTLGLTGKNAPYKTRFGPFPGDIYHAKFPIEYHGVTLKQAILDLNEVFRCEVAVEDTAAIIVEPVQGEGGFYPAPNEFLRALRALCDEHGIVLIADEIQTGFARTGKMFASEHADIEPDLITVAKGMAGGFPIAGVVGKAEIMDAPLPGGLGGTYAGSPVGCAAALAVLDVIENENLLEAAKDIEGLFKEKLLSMKAAYPDIIGDIRASHGAMVAVELVHNGSADHPNTEIIGHLISIAHDRGLILLKCGIRGNVIRFLPALTIEPEILAEGIQIFEDSFAEAIGRASQQ